LNLTTGTAKAGLTLLNFLNTYLVNSQWVTVVINNFGDWSKDLVLPSPDELLSTRLESSLGGRGIVIGNSGEDSFTDALVVDRTETDALIKNDANVKSKITTATVAGGDFIGFADDIEDSSITAGNATNLSSQFMLANTTKIGGGFFNLFVNDLSKQWSGGLVGAPTDASVKRDAHGAVVTAERGLEMPQPEGATIDRSPGVTIDNSGNDAMNIARVTRDRQIVINASNNGSIVNDIHVQASSGGNMITGLDGRRIHIKDGDAQTSVTIGNVVNTTMIGAKAMNVIINNFGKWTGKVVFGKAVDLRSIITPSKSGNLAPGEEISYTIDYQNANEKEATKNAKLTAHYDASKMELVDAGGATENPVGTLTWNIGDVPAGGTGQRTFRARVQSPLPVGNHTIIATSNITSERPESNNDNNRDATSNTVTVAGGSGPVTPPTQNGEGTVSGQAQQGNQGTGSNNNHQTTSGGQTNGSNGNGGGAHFNTPGGSSSSGSSGVTLRISKSSNVSSVARGGVVTYTVRLQNTGSESASSVKVFDKLRVNGISSPEDEFSWEVGTVPAGEQVTIEYDVNIEPDAELGTYTNTAYASGFDSRNKVVLSNDSLATVTVGGGSGEQVSGNAHSGGNGGTTISNEVDDGSETATGVETTPHQSSSISHPRPSTSSGNHSGPRGVTITHPDGTKEVIGNGSGRSARSTPNVTRGTATINRAVLISGALEAQARAVQDAPITNTNGPVTTLTMASMDQVLGEQISRERNDGLLMWLWLVLLILLVIVGFLAWREQKKEKNNLVIM